MRRDEVSPTVLFVLTSLGRRSVRPFQTPPIIASPQLAKHLWRCPSCILAGPQRDQSIVAVAMKPIPICLSKSCKHLNAFTYFGHKLASKSSLIIDGIFALCLPAAQADGTPSPPKEASGLPSAQEVVQRLIRMMIGRKYGEKALCLSNVEIRPCLEVLASGAVSGWSLLNNLSIIFSILRVSGRVQCGVSNLLLEKAQSPALLHERREEGVHEIVKLFFRPLPHDSPLICSDSKLNYEA